MKGATSALFLGQAQGSWRGCARDKSMPRRVRIRFHCIERGRQRITIQISHTVAVGLQRAAVIVRRRSEQIDLAVILMGSDAGQGGQAQFVKRQARPDLVKYALGR